MSFSGEVSGEKPAIIFDDPEKQWIADHNDARSLWNELSLGLSVKGTQDDIAAIREILPWYGMNALTHYLTPYGLEQFSGAAWGTRDVTQGPVELLLCMQKYKEAKQVLRIIFSNQDPDGGWPQWWMFDGYNDIRADSAHGDVMYWCLIALSNYIKTTNDFDFLDEVLPFYNKNKNSEKTAKSLQEHINRLVNKVIGSFVPGTSLVQFGGGDWNDSLQPVSRELASRMISAWTVEMSYQAFNEYAEVWRMRGETVRAGEYNKLCERIKSDFNRHLVKEGIVAGYGLAEDDGTISLLLHPTDRRTGIKYSILPMNRGIISRMFTAGQALRHQELIEMHLKGPDGVRLMDRPLKYSGGIETLFRRAESGAFFGREIGLMYVHEHIRYAEAMALTGNADAFLHALRQAIPVAYRDIVTSGDIRQSNCYYSSSDAIFRNRYEADRLYSEILNGNMTLSGGWRIYSSGPGIFIGLVVSRLLGLRINWGKVIIDPVMPRSFDGIQVCLKFMERSLTMSYSVKDENFGPKRICINGSDIAFEEEENNYRRGGAVIEAGQFRAMLSQDTNTVEIQL
ncbi:MAG: amylo-alpha-1,6-glucosidase [Bacteroidales bacterium]|nr:amylo-alpha-1,6-glucosidase [Bacteroidales bacterium]